MFLHGLGGGAWSWAAQRAEFAARYRLFAWDARGHGRSPRVSDAGLADYYVDAVDALDYAFEESARPVFVAGHSMGGFIAIALASDRPQAVRGLFLVDPVYSDARSGIYRWFAPGLRRVARWLCEPLLHSFDRNGKASRLISRWLFERAFTYRERMEEAWPNQRAQVPVEYPRTLREPFDKPVGFELRDFAREIVAPTYVLDIFRTGGRLRFPQLIAGLSEQLGPRFIHESIAGGHYLQLDRPGEVNERLRRFVEAYE